MSLEDRKNARFFFLYRKSSPNIAQDLEATRSQEEYEMKICTDRTRYTYLYSILQILNEENALLYADTL